MSKLWLVVYELIQLIKQAYRDHQQRARDKEIEEIKKDAITAWGDILGTTTGELSSDDAAGENGSMPASKTDNKESAKQDRPNGNTDSRRNGSDPDLH